MASKKVSEKSIAQKFNVVSRTIEACTQDERVKLIKMLADAYVIDAPVAKGVATEVAP